MERVMVFCIAGWSGFFVMGVELLSGRILAPSFGSGIYVWGGIITVFMLALSLGYLLGGRWSLHEPTLRRLASLLLLAAATTAPIALFAESLLDRLFDVFHDPRYGSLVSAALLFFVPTVVCGMVSPYAVRLLVTEYRVSGQVAGLLYFVSTLGSAAGTLATSFYLVLWFDIGQILWGMSAVSLLLGGIGLLVPQRAHALA
ncbi:MAG TPA: fused MFS/spermidine synthase [Casimicrobiaceae bacterium]